MRPHRSTIPLLVAVGSAGLGAGLPSSPPAAESSTGPETGVGHPCVEEAASPVEVDEERLLAFVGHYSHASLPFDLHVELMDDALRAVVPARAAAYPLIALGDDLFCLEGAPSRATLEFAVEAERTVAVLTQNDSRIELVRQGW